MARKSSGIERETRRSKVCDFILRGHTYREIARDLACSLATVHQDVHAVLAEWREERIEKIGDMLAVQHRILDKLQRVLMPLVDGGDMSAIDRTLQLVERRLKLYGLDSKALANQVMEIVEQQASESAEAKPGRIADGLRNLEALVQKYKGRALLDNPDGTDGGDPALN